MPPFDAVLIVSFGGPQGPDDVRPFLENVLRGRRVAPGRLEEVAHHYELFGGVSPLTALTMQAGAGASGAAGPGGGCRCRSTSACATGIRISKTRWRRCRAPASGARSGSSPRRTAATRAARSTGRTSPPRGRRSSQRRACRRRGHLRRRLARSRQGFIEPTPARARTRSRGCRRWPAAIAPSWCSPRTASRSAWRSAIRIARQFEETARLVAARVERSTRPRHEALPYAAVYQSRSGRPDDPWLGPDVCDYLREARRAGLDAAVLCPVGFLVDHVEVLYDLDIEAAAVAASSA